MAGLKYYKALGSNGQELSTGDGHGSCTGMYQWGHRRLPEGTTTLVQRFVHTENLSRSAMEQIAATPLMQALVPGMSYEGARSHDPGFVFPGIDTLPSDQVVCAMRILKAFLGGYTELHQLREYEFTMAELLPIASFYQNGIQRGSDSRPLLAAATFEELIQSYTENPPSRDSWGRRYQELRRLSHAGAILPLIRGEIRQGYQANLIQGYLKDGSLLSGLSFGIPAIRDYRNPERGFNWEAANTNADAQTRQWLQMIPMDASYTVNHPLIHFTEEAQQGPLCDGRTPVLEWLATQLGK